LAKIIELIIRTAAMKFTFRFVLGNFIGEISAIEIIEIKAKINLISIPM
jgi:hypothetical protein